jgi:hypothetical protein
MARKCEIEDCDRNVFGKNRCMYHYPRTPIKKISERKKESLPEQIEKVKEVHLAMLNFFNKSDKKCIGCGKEIKEFRTYNVDHLLEKSTYPDLSKREDNMVVVCMGCHSMKTNGFPKENHLQAINNFKQIYEKEKNL